MLKRQTRIALIGFFIQTLTICQITLGAEDPFTETPFESDYKKRHAAFMRYQAENRGGGPYYAAARVAQGLALDEGHIRGALNNMNARRDCADFGLHGVLRLLYQFPDSPLVSKELRERARQSILKFKYWPDEPGVDSMCYWSENHHILFAAGGYLAGRLYPDAVFENSGQTGREKMEICRPRVMKWLELRYKTGFSEWLSNVYYDEDLVGIINLVDFSGDAEISRRAAMVTDLMLADIALNSHRGVFGSTHGRSYEGQKKWARGEATASLEKLLFGLSRYQTGSISATTLALSEGYRAPRVLYEIAADQERAEIVNKQRVGIRLDEAERWGLDFDRLEDGMTFLSFEAYSAPKTINLTMRMIDEYNWWENEFFEPFKKQKQLINTARALRLLPLIAWWYERDLTRNMREEVNIYTYRTPDYMLSSAQDYRKGYGGDQQHIWQATLGPDAACFTTHPSRRTKRGNDTPNYWTGSGTLPRAAQIENVAICVYDISTSPGLYVTNDQEFTHAWFPRDKFDAVVEKNGWFFAKRDDGYLALWSRNPAVWQEEKGEDKGRELIAQGKRNIWICEMGRASTDGPFEKFIDRVSNARLRSRGLNVTYNSPSQGQLEFGWQGPLRQNGEAIALSDYARYDNPYCQAEFPGDKIEFRLNDHWLRLDWAENTREGSAFLGE